jgi:serine/threonine-protein phosphatase 5
LYSEAIQANPTDATLYCNRTSLPTLFDYTTQGALTRMKLEENGYAIADATAAISIDPKYVKAYYRRALCQLSILKPQLAVPDFKMVLKLEPTNKQAKEQLDATTKLIRRMQFEAVSSLLLGRAYSLCSRVV